MAKRALVKMWQIGPKMIRVLCLQTNLNTGHERLIRTRLIQSST